MSRPPLVCVYGLQMDPGWKVSKAIKLSESLAPGGHLRIRLIATEYEVEVLCAI